MQTSGSLLLRENNSIVVKTMDLEAKLPGFESYLLLLSVKLCNWPNPSSSAK